MNIDEVIAQMKLDEEEDAKFITPVNYGRLRGVAPQNVYYYIRRGYIKVRTCDCGRKVIEKEEADEYLRRVGKLKPNSERPSGATEEDRGEGPEVA
jgi:hypothetical protein